MTGKDSINLNEPIAHLLTGNILQNTALYFHDIALETQPHK